MDKPRASPVASLPSAMDKIGKFEIIKELGKGATSAVYQAFDPFQSRHVAIKVVFPEALGDKEHGKRYRKLFVTEASLAGKLSHPHIVAIYDAVESGNGSLARTLSLVISLVAIAVLYLTNRLERRQAAG